MVRNGHPGSRKAQQHRGPKCTLWWKDAQILELEHCAKSVAFKREVSAHVESQDVSQMRSPHDRPMAQTTFFSMWMAWAAILCMRFSNASKLMISAAWREFSFPRRR